MKACKMSLLAILACCFLLTGCGGSSKPQAVKTDPQPAVTYPGWTTVKLGKAGTLQIPDTMEVQTDAYVKKAQEAVKANSQKLLIMQEQSSIAKKAGTIICQTKGLNDQGPAGEEKSKYAQVIFSSIPVKDKIPAYGRPIGLNESQIADFGDITKKGIMAKESVANSTIKYLDWKPMKSEIINGAECLNIAYDYQIGTNPAVHVERYTFFDTNVIYTLEVLSRTGEKDYWHAKDKDISNIVNTLNIKSK